MYYITGRKAKGIAPPQKKGGGKQGPLGVTLETAITKSLFPL